MNETQRYSIRKFIHISFALIVFAVGILLSQLVTAQSQVPTYKDVQVGRKV
jgi:hypothetical protein